MQLQNQLRDALKEQLNDPIVTVSVYDVRSKTYSITGEVMRPGSYPLIKNPTTVFEAVNQAGGFRDNFANQTHIMVLRGNQRLSSTTRITSKGRTRTRTSRFKTATP